MGSDIECCTIPVRRPTSDSLFIPLLLQINFLFLLNILRVLLTKLKNVNSSETEKVR